MHTEYEVRILEIDVQDMIRRLEKVHASLLWDRVQKRYVYDFVPKQKNKWIRLRTNGEKTTLTIKNLATSKIDGTQELEIEVDHFERCHLMLKELGYDGEVYKMSDMSNF